MSLPLLAARPLADAFGRVHDDLRISVTDRCNLRCGYCMPIEPRWFPREEILSFEEIAELADIFTALGVRRLRVSGGEPLVRRELPRLIAMLTALPLEDLSLTTNGVLLDGAALPLARAGLRRVNVSLDTLDRGRFEKLTRRDALDRVLRGLAAAEAAGLAPIKVNTVLTRGFNDGEIETLAATARERGWQLRFIECMPLDNAGRWNADTVVPGAEVRERISRLWPIEPEPQGDPRAPATLYRYRDGKGSLGFIDSVTNPFCGDCGRLRLTADGALRVCLYDDREVDLKTPLRARAERSEIERLIANAVARKGRGGALDIVEQRRAPTLTRTMHQIGG